MTRWMVHFLLLGGMMAIFRWISRLGVAWAFALIGLSSAQAQESFQVVSVNATGCSSGNFAMSVLRSNLDGGNYTVRTVVTVGSLVYMNEAANISQNGTSNWNVFDNFSYGSVPNPGTYPIPAGQMTLDFTLERPVGTVLYAWRLVVDGCATGNIVSNGPLAANSVNAVVPTMDVEKLIILFALVLLMTAFHIRPRRDQP